jgi:hypothetical protein
VHRWSLAKGKARTRWHLPAGTDQQENLHFSIGQASVAFFGRAVKPARENARVHARGDDNVAPQHRFEGVHDALQFLSFHEITEGSGLECAFGIKRFIMLRKDKNARLRMYPQALGHEIRPIATAQHQIEQSQIRLFSRQQPERLGRGSRFAANLEGARLLQHRAKPHAHDGMVVDDQNP